MNPQFEIVLSVVAIATGGALVARRLQTRRQRANLAKRLEIWDEQPGHSEPASVLKPKASFDHAIFPATNVVARKIELLINQSGEKMTVSSFIAMTVVLFILPIAAHLLYDLHSLVAVGTGLMLATLPFAWLMVKRAARRTKFINQLPDAIDLMISILQSGHSIPQAVKTVGEESPSPCSDEFNEVMQRLNIGQRLPEALNYSCEKYKSVELDLLRRAVSIQSEVGGSLAELLEKTNSTLRQRLKLVRQVKVLTTQSRLTAIVVGLLPLFTAAGLQIINPGYLNPLFETDLGNTLLAVSVVLQIFGIALMHKMATVKV